MKKLSVAIAKLMIRDKRPVDIPEVRAKYGIMEGWLSILVNLLLFGIKITAGLKVQSAALIADAVHTLADSATSIVVIIGFKISQKPSDAEHPFGHGRVEPIATLIISILLFVAGFELLHHSINSILTPSNSKAGYLIIFIILGTAVIKELLARFSFAIGDYINSDALKADALHHRSDVFATILVVVALIASRYGYYNIDGIMGCFVSLIIFYSAYLIAKDAISPLLGEAPSPEFLKQVETLCLSIPGVLGVHDIISHQYGQNRITSLHIEVCHKENAVELHTIAEQIEDAIGTTTHGIAVVHIDPVNKNHPGYEAVSAIIRATIEKDDNIESFYDLKIIGENIETASILFDIETAETTPETENHAIIASLSNHLKSTFPGLRVRIKANPKFSYNVKYGDN